MKTKKLLTQIIKKKMKKLVFTLGLCMVASISFGQKKAVTDALKKAKESKPNFVEARTLIKGALENAETKDDPKTWYTAGQIESLQLDQESTKQLLKQPFNEEVMYGALVEVYPYFVKAYELDMKPDAKGSVKPKFVKDMKSILTANMGHYMNGGIYYFDKKEFKKSHDLFNQFVEVFESPIMGGNGKTNTTTSDSSYLYSNYYAAITASMHGDLDLSIKAMSRASQLDFKRNEMYQFLSDEYKKAGDTINWEKTLNEGLALYPKDEFILFNLIDLYLNTDRNTKALEYINTAIQNNPEDAQLYGIAGRIYESGIKDMDKAEEFFKKALDMDKESAEANSNMGRVFFNRGVVLLDEASKISDVKQYNEEREKAREVLKMALPFFEKAFKLDPDIMENRIALRSIYYNLEMNDKLKELETIIGGGS